MPKLEKASHWFQIVSGVVAVIMLILYVRPTSGEAINESAMKTYILPGFLGLCILLAAAFHLASAWITKTKKAKPETPETPKQVTGIDQKEHERIVNELSSCHEAIAGWRSEVEHQRERFDVLQTVFDDTKWLRDRAEYQASQLARFVDLEPISLGHCDLDRTDAYIEFSVMVWNRSIYDIQIDDLVGPMGLNTREFRQRLSWKEHARVIKSAHNGYFNFRQDLTSEDVNYVKRNKAHFTFWFEIRASGVGQFAAAVKSQPLALSGTPPTNEGMYQPEVKDTNLL